MFAKIHIINITGKTFNNYFFQFVYKRYQFVGLGRFYVIKC